jgi:hypothetical protein
MPSKSEVVGTLRSLAHFLDSIKYQASTLGLMGLLSTARSSDGKLDRCYPALAENLVGAGQSRFGQVLVALARAPLGEGRRQLRDDAPLCCFDWRTSA